MTYRIQITTNQLFAKNESEWSLPSEKFTVYQNDMPSEPTSVRVSSCLIYCQIKIGWKAPDCSLTHEIIKQKTKILHNDNGKLNAIPANKFSATFTKLDEDTHYCFLIRTCSRSHASEWVIIEAKTKKKDISS